MSHFGDLVFGKKAEPAVEPKVVEQKPIETVKKTTSESKLKI